MLPTLASVGSRSVATLTSASSKRNDLVLELSKPPSTDDSLHSSCFRFDQMELLINEYFSSLLKSLMLLQ